MEIKGIKITLVKADITELKADAIVNAANDKLVMGGGVAGAIKRIGGAVIEEEAVHKGPIAIGAAVASGAGSLPARYVIHAVTMGLDFKTDEYKIRQAAASALNVAQDLQLKSIVFPALGCGTGGFPLLASAKIMAQEVYKYSRRDARSLKEIIFCLNGQEALVAFNKGVIGYLTYVTEKLGFGPYITVDAIIELDGGIVLIERSNPPFGWALPGGFVDYGESLESAVIREAKEETGLDIIDVRQMHTYSAPERDPRFHTINTVFIAKAAGTPLAGDDAKGVRVVKLDQLAGVNFAFDHRSIIEDYLACRQGKTPF